MGSGNTAPASVVSSSRFPPSPRPGLGLLNSYKSQWTEEIIGVFRQPAAGVGVCGGGHRSTPYLPLGQGWVPWNLSGWFGGCYYQGSLGRNGELKGAGVGVDRSEGWGAAGWRLGLGMERGRVGGEPGEKNGAGNGEAGDEEEEG